MKITLDHVLPYAIKGYFCSILISNIIFVFLSFFICLCFFFSATIKTLFSFHSLLRIPLFVLSELLSHEANCKEPSKDFPYIRMNVIRFTFIVCE